MSATLYINGAWRPATAGGTRTITCPADQSEVGIVSEATEADTIEAIQAARAAFDSGVWSEVPAAERGDFVLKIADTLAERKEDFARAEALDTGKRIVEARMDMDDIIACFRYFGKLADADAGRVVDAGDPNVASVIVHEPIGVCGLITPWNYPLLQAAWKVAPALAAGNTFVLKPAELTPHTAILLIQLLEDLGLPAGVANLITGAGANCGNPLSQHPDVDLVSFTGGLTTGRIIAANAADTVKKIALELGGKNPNIIFADADFDAAVDNAVNGGFVHSGQVCSAGARIIVEESIAEKFTAALLEKAEAIRLGGPYDAAAESSPLISAEHRDKVHQYVQDGIAEGVRVRCGGRFAEDADADHDVAAGLSAGYYYLPTVLDQVSRGMSVVTEEAFGPVVTVETFRTEEEAIATANDTIYGLAGAVWSKDTGKAQRIARKLRHGTIWINDFHPYLPQAEWGGFSQSGIGRELGPTGLAEYQEAKHIYQNLAPAVTGWFGPENSNAEHANTDA
ncbi:aldehyde dehydrogenase family protein [Micrococcoides hystricis]|uniref:Aldehyde dehydrogenase family protein n=1 Tax=Micrococcoides hystricis TaxID=1572761 RepID=A0ABV6PCE7_9MICC